MTPPVLVDTALWEVERSATRHLGCLQGSPHKDVNGVLATPVWMRLRNTVIVHIERELR